MQPSFLCIKLTFNVLFFRTILVQRMVRFSMTPAMIPRSMMTREPDALARGLLLMSEAVPPGQCQSPSLRRVHPEAAGIRMAGSRPGRAMEARAGDSLTASVRPCLGAELVISSADRKC